MTEIVKKQAFIHCNYWNNDVTTWKVEYVLYT